MRLSRIHIYQGTRELLGYQGTQDWLWKKTKKLLSSCRDNWPSLVEGGRAAFIQGDKEEGEWDMGTFLYSLSYYNYEWTWATTPAKKGMIARGLDLSEMKV